MFDSDVLALRGRVGLLQNSFRCRRVQRPVCATARLRILEEPVDVFFGRHVVALPAAGAQDIQGPGVTGLGDYHADVPALHHTVEDRIAAHSLCGTPHYN